MTDTRSGGASDGDAGSWTSETLPLSIRKELLERELRKLGFRKAGSQPGGSHDGGSAQQQQQPQSGSSSHPSAGGDADSHGG
jgi:hypothetical protein